MEYTSLPILLSEDGDKALQIYKFILDEINSSKLVAGDKLPSIRRLCESLNISKKIVERSLCYVIRRRLAFVGARAWIFCLRCWRQAKA
ncbi:MAG: GntR family transcriptional regulator [Ezakiella sp.]|nr:GntR family transcriptional regulator [Ezakiella sp.]MDD7761589.1 GntR family transcriptional regulator [Bacillota bacterium]MDY3947355.1 GntR family transcriptional regulator [Ezakiella sp.]